MKKAFTTLVAFLICYSIYSQSNEIYQVVLYKSKASNVKSRKFIKIDSLGNIFSFNKPTGEKIDLKKFNHSIAQFVKNELNVEKIPANDNENAITVLPKTAEHIFEVTVKFLEDFRAEKNRKSMTKYYWVKIKNS